MVGFKTKTLLCMWGRRGNATYTKCVYTDILTFHLKTKASESKYRTFDFEVLNCANRSTLILF